MIGTKQMNRASPTENLNLDYNKEVLVRRALLKCHTKEKAAKLLGVRLTQLEYLMRKYGIVSVEE